MSTPETVSFGYEQVPATEKTAKVGEVFSRVARKYDIMNDAMSGGMHRLWKDRFVRRVKPRAGEAILDMAGGTGDIAFRMEPFGASITVADINPDMLGVGMERAAERGIDSLVWSEQNAETLSFPDQFFDAYTIAFGIRNVTDIPAALTEAHRVLRYGGRFFCLEFSTNEWPGFAQAYDAYSHQLVPKLGKLIAQDEDSYRYLIESIRRFPADARIREDDRRGGLHVGQGRADHGRAGRDPQRVESLTRPVTHILRLLKWGRILARHGALRGIETAPQTPPGVKRLCRIARFGTVQPKIPDYAAAFQAIGPAAVKLGQTLATRPDLVGEDAARNLLSLQDALAPVAVRAHPPRDRGDVRGAARKPVSRIRSRPRRLGVDRAGSSRGDDRGPPGRGQGSAAPASTSSSRATSKPMNGRPRISRRSAAKRRGCGRGR